jgi:hypothetical protein
MSDFSAFAHMITARFNKLSKQELFVVGDNNRAFEAVYLLSFPEGTDPIYKTETEHNCNCCKQFLRNIGNVVAIVDGKIESIWAAPNLPYPYDIVAAKMDEFVRSQPITDLFRPTETTYGKEKTTSMEDGRAKVWNHFNAKVAAAHICDAPATVSGTYRTKVQTFKRGLNELAPSAFDTVSDLIANNTLYKGAEFASYVNSFRNAQKKFLALKTPEEKEVFLWQNCSEGASFRGSSIGTLVQDLSEGKDVEDAVGSYEFKVAPQNYKRPTALITPAMVKAAMATIKELELDEALERRYAVIGDITINNVIWADNSVKSKMKGGLEDLLLAAAKAPVSEESNAEDILIDDFMAVLPGATSVEVMVKGNHLGNLMSVTAPVYITSPKMFRWDNGFAWSYSGNITDSIKEKVKKAGGNVNAKLRISLSWFNYDDLDIHVIQPDGKEIYYGNKDGKLDVDMNAGSGTSRDAVENVSFMKVPDGIYKVRVHQFAKRETSDLGFVVEVDNEGAINQFKFPRSVTGTVDVCNVHVKNGAVVKFDTYSGVTAGSIAQNKWGIKTESFVKVNTIMFSPNYWDDNAVGNKHWFFLLDGCVSDEPTRGIYNEFLNPTFDKHRKVFEVIGDRTKCQPTPSQLSGLGFSSTKSDSVIVKVKFAKSQKSYRILF